MRSLTLSLALFSGLFGPARAQTPTPTPARAESVKPGINKDFLDPNLKVEEFTAKFELESREVYAQRGPIVEALGLKPGDEVADIGAGTGLFVPPFADAVGPDGHVFAVDISPRFVENLSRLAEDKGLTNVTPVLCGGRSAMLPAASVDAAFVCDVYHHFEYPERTLASLRRAIRPGGTLNVIDFERIPGVTREWLLNHVRAGKEVFRAEIEAAGFEFVEEVDLPGMEENYFLRFRRK